MDEWNGNNRRNFVRMKYPCLLVITREASDRISILTHTDNLSAGGVYIVLKDEIELNSLVDLELDLMDMTNHICCEGKIVWLRKREGGINFKSSFYDVGVEFVGLKQEDTSRLEKLVEYLHKRENDVPYK